MDTLTFVASLVQNLAWPITTLIIIIVLRKPLVNLFTFVQKLKYKDIELEFGQRVEEARAEAVQQLPPNTQEIPRHTPERESIARLAEVSPRAAVLESWRTLELAAIETARKVTDEKFYKMTYQVIAALEHNENIDRTAVNLLKELRALRNEAAHGPEFALSQASALEYAATAEKVTSYLRSFVNSA